MTTPTTPAADAVSLHIAATNCEHVISAACIKLYFDPTLPGHNALNQLARRLEAAALARESALVAEGDALKAALLQAARDVEDLKLPCPMDCPESRQAARNSLYMSIAAKARAALAAPAVEG